ncbi:Bromodomain and PHD finger-containing protein 1 [Homalodisca vitripennis]|nr:Bromodomain and PHD finger-containing protein 1 [Homalodisca vitripennis]
MCTEVELCPLVCFLRKLVDLLRARDTGEIFIEPVDQSEVPDYGDVVKHPMDLSTMRQKVDDFEYSCLEEFQADFHLMIDNCLAYNSKDTVFYRAALKMRDQGGMLLRQAAKDLEVMGLEGGSGVLKRETPGVNSAKTAATPADETLPAEIDKQLSAIADAYIAMGEDEIMCKLLQLQDSCQNLKHGLARAKRIKMVKAEIAKLKKKSSSENGLVKGRLCLIRAHVSLGSLKFANESIVNLQRCVNTIGKQLSNYSLVDFVIVVVMAAAVSGYSQVLIGSTVL